MQTDCVGTHACTWYIHTMQNLDIHRLSREDRCKKLTRDFFRGMSGDG